MPEPRLPKFDIYGRLCLPGSFRFEARGNRKYVCRGADAGASKDHDGKQKQELEEYHVQGRCHNYDTWSDDLDEDGGDADDDIRRRSSSSSSPLSWQ